MTWICKKDSEAEQTIYVHVYKKIEWLLFKVNAYLLSVIGYMFMFMDITNGDCLTNN